MEPQREQAAERLAPRLRRETAALHEAAERAPLMAALIAGTIERRAYVALLANLLPIYRALEGGLDRHRDDARLSFACAHGLARAARLAEDLATLSDGRDRPPPVTATLAYCEHLHALASERPLHLLAHAYVRYLGDLYGGQQLARTLQRCFGLQGTEGTRFYDFGPAESLPAQRAAFRAGLDALGLRPDEADALVSEARGAFERHLALFAELAASR